MKTSVERILRDLYRIDPALRDREDELKKAIGELIESKPEAKMDPVFERELKEKLMASFSEDRGARKGFRLSGRSRYLLSRPAAKAGIGAIAACLVLAVLLQTRPWSSATGGEAALPTAAVQEQATALSEPSPAGAPAGAPVGAPLAASPSAAVPGKPKSAASVPTAKGEASGKLELGDALSADVQAPREEARAIVSAGMPKPAESEKEKRTLAAAADKAAAPATAPAPAPARKSDSAASEAVQALQAQTVPSPEAAALADRDNPAFNREGYDGIVESSFAKTLEEPLSTFSIDVDTASYSNVRRFLQGGSLPPPDAVRIEELVNYFSYDYPDPSGDRPFGFDTELGPCPWNPDHLLLRVGLQARRVAEKDMPPSNLVFLVDVSGSMDEENKLPLVKESLKLLARRMRQQDRIALVVYAGSAGLVLPSTPGSDKQRILAAIDGLDAGGSTAGGEGILLAYETAKKAFLAKGNNRVILATDGDFNVGASSDGELVRIIEQKRKEGVFLTVLGFGMGNYQDSKMQKLADAGNGNYAYVDGLSEAVKVLSKQMAGTLYAVAKDVKVQIEFNPAMVGEYRLIGYEKRALAARDFADDTKDAGELGAGGSVTALYELAPSKGAIGRSDLKYQSAAIDPKAARSGELMTIKFRYKLPDGDASIPVEEPVPYAKRELAKSSDNFRFAAAVAEFGLLLRDSAYKGSASWAQVQQLAAGARGADGDGYRAEFLGLAKLAAQLTRER